MHATRIAKERGADEAIFVTPDGVVLEAPTSSVFWAGPDGMLKTPSLDNPILDSITRDRVIRAIEVEEGTYDVSDFQGATEAFMASTGREVQPLSAIDGVGARLAGPPHDRRDGRVQQRDRDRARHHRGRRRNVNLDLTDEQKLISETARDFVDKEVVERARQNDRDEKFDRELASMLGEMGYLGAPVAEEYGGRGLDYIGYGLIVEQIGRGDSAARTVVSVQTSLVCKSIENWGTEEQKQQWLPKLCSGEYLGCFGLTEPDTGSDAASLRTRAEKTDSRLEALRPEDVDLARKPRERRDDLRPDRARLGPQGARLLPRPHRHRGLLDAGDPRQARAQGLGHRVDRPRRRRGARRLP